MESTWWLRLLALLTVIVLLLLAPTSQSINTLNDLDTLLSFKSFITNDPFGALSSWSAISNNTSNGTHGFCHWNGVTCNGHLHPGRVTALRLRGLGLAGAISPLLGNLTGLRVLDLSDNKLSVAVKVLNLQQRGATRSFITECNALKSIQHRKLVKVITVCDSCNHNGDEFKAIVLEFISNGNLDDWLHPSTVATNNLHGMLNLTQRLNIALDVAEALEYLHYHIEQPIVHRDIKPSNVLLDEDMVAHVSDFGLAKIMEVEASGQYLGETSSVGVKGTIGYLAPEYGAGAEVSVEGDVYSYGVLLLEILTGRRPTDALFDGTTSLPKFVEMAYPDKLLGIVDATIAQSGVTKETVDLFIAPVARLGLACCRDSATQRMRMDEVVNELVAVKKAWEARLSIIH